MNGKLREQISALADDELPVGEHELLARRFSLDKYLSICWEHYHLIGEAMRKALPQADSRGFADRIMKALEDDAASIQQQDSKIISHFSKATAGIGLAACVAVVAIIGLRNDFGARMQSSSAPSEIVPSEARMQTSNISYGMPSNAAWNGNTPEIQAQLTNYVINHNETATTIEQQGMLPYIYMTTVQKWQPYKPSTNPQTLRKQDRR